VNLIGFVCLFSFHCGALRRAAAINPQKRKTTKPINPPQLTQLKFSISAHWREAEMKSLIGWAAFHQ